MYDEADFQHALSRISLRRFLSAISNLMIDFMAECFYAFGQS